MTFHKVVKMSRAGCQNEACCFSIQSKQAVLFLRALFAHVRKLSELPYLQAGADQSCRVTRQGTQVLLIFQVALFSSLVMENDISSILDQILHVFEPVFRPKVTCFPVLTPFYFSFSGSIYMQKMHITQNGVQSPSHPSSALTHTPPPPQRATTNAIFSLSLQGYSFYSVLFIHLINTY